MRKQGYPVEYVNISLGKDSCWRFIINSSLDVHRNIKPGMHISEESSNKHFVNNFSKS